MYLFYADESGHAREPSERYFILAGVVVFERRLQHLFSALDQIAARFDSDDPRKIELHGSPMLTGHAEWRRCLPQDRIAAIKDALRVINTQHECIIASVVNKFSAAPRDPFHVALQQIITRFDYYLTRKLAQHSEEASGIMLLDKAPRKEIAIQNLVRDFQEIGHPWGTLKNLHEVPVFLDSKASRLVQLADLVAYALFRHFERGDSQFYEIIKDKFDRAGSVVHGLHLWV